MFQYFSSLYLSFWAGKINLQNKRGRNHVYIVRLIPSTSSWENTDHNVFEIIQGSFNITVLQIVRSEFATLYLIFYVCPIRSSFIFVNLTHQNLSQGVFLGGLGDPHLAKILSIPPSDTWLRFWIKACPPPPAEVRPPKFEKLKYIFVSNLTTFKLKSTFKSCISCLKLQKKGLILQ